MQKLLPFHEPAVEQLADVSQVLRMAALDLRERLGVEVVVVEGEPSLAGDERAGSRQPGNSGMKWSGAASSTLISSRSLSAAKARKKLSASGSGLTSTSIVLVRQP